ncbi:nuclear transport factor 2 family protein [Zunongwangia sp. H14]|uniref:nuclear transport factor 2 family protein n=1 Tax=Zunongwangia sp. H14 TaxID=3240792 RepID=UPI00356710EF
MKKLITLFLIMAFISCNNNKKVDEEKEEQRYTQQSPEIEVMKSAIKDYEDGNWESFASHYAEDAAIYTNSEDSVSVSEIISARRDALKPFDTYRIRTSPDEYEMVVTDKGETWVNFWGVWEARITGTSNTVNMPLHITQKYENGKIVKEYGYYDSGRISSALSETAAINDSIIASSSEN